ncbi:hypothetical protein HPB48_013299 [Haemaphysalis longicornis]|uniref:Uncharacterized protein n=1 Tax=Haemaphysalis longicornis TaxID=44386 RepID=A0A9J6GR49_HAELO|nr:hypothetical protein HPB48_013299 [Haemaphysalis longicornis]
MGSPTNSSAVSLRPTDFTAAGYMGPARLLDKDHGSVLPLSLRYLTPEFVSVLGMVGITAAIMSSVDSSMLSAASIVTRNAYEVIFRRSKSDLQVAQTLRLAIWMIGSCATYLALQVRSVLKLWIFSSEFVYVLLFPHFLCVFYFKKTNAYGSLLAFILGASFRLMCGEPSVNLPVIIKLPLYDEEAGQRFPFRLTGMCLCLVTLLVGSYVATALFEEGRLSQRWDVLQCFKKKAPGTVELKHDGTTQLSRSEPAVAAKEEPPTNAATAKDKVSGWTRILMCPTAVF